MKSFRAALVSGLAAILFSGQASADQIFVAHLTGDQENPPTGAAATAEATFILSSDQTMLSYFIHLTSGLDFGGDPSSANHVMAMHLHEGARGVSGPVVLGIINPNNDANDLVIDVGNETASGIFEGNEGNAGHTLATELPFLLAGELYLNIHTPAFPAGEIRGQVEPVAEPSTWTLLGAGVAGLFALRRLFKVVAW